MCKHKLNQIISLILNNIKILLIPDWFPISNALRLNRLNQKKNPSVWLRALSSGQDLEF